jgi:hypothetical protein
MATISKGTCWVDQTSIVWEVITLQDQSENKAFRLRSPLRDQVVTEAWFRGKMEVSDESFTNATQRS